MRSECDKIYGNLQPSTHRQEVEGNLNLVHQGKDFSWLANKTMVYSLFVHCDKTEKEMKGCNNKF